MSTQTAPGSSKTKPTREQLDQWHSDPSNWYLGFLYFNRTDTRLLPPKRNQFMGWTVNFANPWSILMMVAITALTIVVGIYIERL